LASSQPAVGVEVRRALDALDVTGDRLAVGVGDRQVHVGVGLGRLGGRRDILGLGGGLRRRGGLNGGDGGGLRGLLLPASGEGEDEREAQANRRHRDLQQSADVLV
jgi:hypothetical protein